MIMERDLLILWCPPPTSFCVLSTPCTSYHNCCPPASLSLQVTVPSELTALMSGERLISEQHPTKAGKMVFRFRQEIPIPSYLVALVVGALESRWRLECVSPKKWVYYMKGISILSHQWHRINKSSLIAFMMGFRILTNSLVSFILQKSNVPPLCSCKWPILHRPLIYVCGHTGATAGVRLRWIPTESRSYTFGQVKVTTY